MNKWLFKPGLIFKITGKPGVYRVGPFQDQREVEAYSLLDSMDLEIGDAMLYDHYIVISIEEELHGEIEMMTEYFKYEELEVLTGNDL